MIVVKNLTNFLYHIVYQNYYVLQLYLIYFWAVDVDIIVDRNVKNTVCRVKVCELNFESKHVWTKHCIGGGRRSNTSLSHWFF